MPSLTPKYLRSLPVDMSLLRQIENLAYARGTQRLYQTQTPELLKHLTTIAQVESTESSTRLEGAVAPAPESKASSWKIRRQRTDRKPKSPDTATPCA
ncbi:MAG: hypothetical protein ACOC9T_03995 [Myxococcota bacterium]